MCKLTPDSTNFLPTADTYELAAAGRTGRSELIIRYRAKANTCAAGVGMGVPAAAAAATAAAAAAVGPPPPTIGSRVWM